MKKKSLKKIIHIIDNLDLGGVQTLLPSILTPLQKKDPTVEHVVAYIKDGPRRTLIEDAGFRTVHLKQYLPRYPFCLLPQLLFLVLREKPSIIHALLPHGWFIGRLIGWITRVPVVCSVHGFLDYKEYGRYPRVGMRLMGHLAARYITAHQEGKKALMTHQNRFLAPARVTTIYNGADVEQLRHRAYSQPRTRKEFGIADDAFLIGCVSRLSPEKSVDTLLKAFARLKEKCISSGQLRPLQLCIVGDGNEWNKLHSLAQTLGINQDTFFLGQQENPLPFYPLFDCSVLPSQFEGGFAMVLLEAMSLGTPLVMTHRHKSHELITQGENGFFVPVNDFEALCEKLYIMLTSPEVREKFSENGTKLMQGTYSSDRMATEYLQTFREVAAGK